MLVLEAALQQEQAMHGITKAQLASLREDNQRLRQQLHAIRRHTVVNSEHATFVFHTTRLSLLFTSSVGNLGPLSLRAYAAWDDEKLGTLWWTSFFNLLADI